ncbi:MAG: PLP-dependent aspartate aminotransferase family protein [Treponema sp.]|uniref:trans-sulfuration enzyme family protein n=1 Tax=Treponema sp. TaxID=166 RepID=UPI002A915877|nr:PLP-dependent aspartate aminotransferase family protein [Treponema sp.]MDY6396532.1 PLP-dependent aspartate aminotransferase family protein [Treponema sp.]
MNIDTICVRGRIDYEACDKTGAIALPIYQSATFAHPALGQSTGYDYSRLKNPTRDYLEKLVASLDHAEFGFAYNCGLAAITALFDAIILNEKEGERIHVVCSDDLYGGTERFLNTIGKKLGFDTTYTDTTELENVRRASKQNTKIIFIETPGNPLMKITDIKKTAEYAHSIGAILIVDNTFLTPYLQQPILLGADVVVQSGTKFLCGHNDTLAGFVTTNDKNLAEKLEIITKTTGSALPPFDSYMIVRGIKTLSVRLDRQCENALKIVEALKENPRVKEILFPGLPESKGYEISKTQATGFGSMISFYVDSPETVARVLKNVKIIHFAESLGGIDTLITYPATQTHVDVPEEERNKRGITDTLLRLSVGIENADDLIEDLSQALRE